MTQKFAAFDPASGAIIAFYDSHDSPAPPEASVVAIGEAQWRECLAQPGQWIVVNGSLQQVLPTDSQLLAQAQAEQRSLLAGACSTAITGGFVSSALGLSHTYGSQAHDQRNLADVMSASLVPGLPAGWTTQIWCALNGAWTLAPHASGQVQQVHADWLAFRSAQQQRLAALTAQVNAAASIAVVQAVAW